MVPLPQRASHVDHRPSTPLENAPHAAPYIRVALVADMAQTKPALSRLKTGLDDFSAKARGSVA